MRKIFLIIFLAACSAQTGKLKVGFDIDDTVLYSEPAFVIAKKAGKGEIDYAWINTHDRQYSTPISPTIKLIKYFHANGHEVYFITARSADKGRYLSEFLTEIVDFAVTLDKTLFFSPKEIINGFKYTTKHKIMKKLNLDLYYGDSDQDMIAAIKADVFPVRIVRYEESLLAYSSNYFGDTQDGAAEAAPFTKDDLEIFYKAGTGLFGESIYPIIWKGYRD